MDITIVLIDFSTLTRIEKRRLLLVGVAIFFLLALWLVFSPNGALKYYQVKKNLAEVQAQNQELGERNKALKEEITKLTTDKAYLEEIARKDFGLVKKNEIIFQFTKKKKRLH